MSSFGCDDVISRTSRCGVVVAVVAAIFVAIATVDDDLLLSLLLLLLLLLVVVVTRRLFESFGMVKEVNDTADLATVDFDVDIDAVFAVVELAVPFVVDDSVAVDAIDGSVSDCARRLSRFFGLSGSSSSSSLSSLLLLLLLSMSSSSSSI